MAFGVGIHTTNVSPGVIANLVTGAGGTAPKYLALGTGATGAARTAAVGDTALTTELGEGRSGTNAGTRVTTTQTNDTAQWVQTIVATGSRAIDEYGLFDASTTGNMVVSGTQNVVNMVNGDSFQMTVQIQFTPS